MNSPGMTTLNLFAMNQKKKKTVPGSAQGSTAPIANKICPIVIMMPAPSSEVSSFTKMSP